MKFFSRFLLTKGELSVYNVRLLAATVFCLKKNALKNVLTARF
jgi:hypothetical protein